jgi:hypothetical protein
MELQVLLQVVILPVVVEEEVLLREVPASAEHLAVVGRGRRLGPWAQAQAKHQEPQILEVEVVVVEHLVVQEL